MSPLAQVEATRFLPKAGFMMAAPTHIKEPNGHGVQNETRKKCEWMQGSEISRSQIMAMRRVHFAPALAWKIVLSALTQMACGSKESNPLFPFPPGESRGGAGSPHAGSTLPASKKRWHASLLPAPPTRGLPPPCESPAEQQSRILREMRTPWKRLTKPHNKDLTPTSLLMDGTTKSAGWPVFLGSFLLFRSDGWVCRVFEGNQPSPCR